MLMPARTSHRLDVAGARLHYEVRGSGLALLLIPGSNGDAGFFDAVAELLADRYWTDPTEFAATLDDVMAE
ncbi:hypothetical protein GCM10017673_43220 [Streptosporangium violaceochromogenes]|nr:hypothetical protein GCM10017673_43220 [Streptosporangium violaceochromogenes]